MNTNERMVFKRLTGPQYGLIAILAVALLVRLVLALTCRALPDFSDMATYNELALSPGIPYSPPPGYPLFLRGVYTLFGPLNYTAVFVVQGLIGTLTVFLLYAVTKRVAGERAGLIAAGIAAVYPNLVLYGLTTMTEIFGIILAVLLIAAIVLPESERRKSILAAVVLGAGYFFRPAFLFFLPGAFLCIRKRIVFIITIAAVLGPWFAYGHISGESSNRGALGFYKSYNPKATGVKHYKLEETDLGSRELPSGTYLEDAVKFIRNNKWRTLDIIYRKASLILSRGWDNSVLGEIVGSGRSRLYIMLYAYIPIMILGFIGMIRLYSKENRPLTLTTASYLVLIFLLSIFKFRYRVLVEPALIAYSAIFISKKWRPADPGGPVEAA